jgi:plasmid stabilization system protein ParE
VLVLTERAREDVERVAAWYRARPERLAREFLADVAHCLAGLEDFPERHPAVHRGVRRAQLRRFPYMILYTIAAARVCVIGCFRLHQDPRRWMARIGLP